MVVRILNNQFYLCSSGNDRNNSRLEFYVLLLDKFYNQYYDALDTMVVDITYPGPSSPNISHGSWKTVRWLLAGVLYQVREEFKAL